MPASDKTHDLHPVTVFKGLGVERAPLNYRQIHLHRHALRRDPKLCEQLTTAN
jgi:hypothetical protein